MGKVKLSKNKKRKASSGIPNWLLLTIVIVVVAAVLITCIAMLVSSMGIVMRCSSAMKTDNFNVNGNMMTYYFVSTYSNFLDQYGNFLGSLSLGEAVPVTELRHIKFGTNSNDALFLGAFSGETWFDYIMSQTKDSVKNMLVYCEEAHERGIELTKEEKNQIKENLKNSILSFQAQNEYLAGSSDNSTLGTMYGKGVRKSDVLKAMEYSALAAKCQEIIYDEIVAAATDEEITKIYNNSKKTYDLVDYYTYTFSISCEDILKELKLTEADLEKEENYKKVLEAYLAKIDAVKTQTKLFEGVTDLDGFKKVVYQYVVDKEYDAAYTAQKIGTGVEPTEADRAAIRQEIIKKVVEEALSDAESAADDKKTDGDKVTLYGIEVKSDFATAAKKIKDELFKKAKAIDSTSLMEEARYGDIGTFGDWAFAADRKAGDIKTDVEGGYSEDPRKMEAEKFAEFKKNITAKKLVAEKFITRTYFMIKPQYQNTELSRDVAYMLFKDKDSATKAISKIEVLGTGLNKDTFASAATEAGAAGNSFIEDYMKGNMSSEAFDDWLFGAEAKPGDYTKTPIVMTDGSYMVALYAANGDPSWKVTVRNHTIEESYEAFHGKMMEKHGGKVDISGWTIDRIAVDKSHSHDEETTAATK